VPGVADASGTQQPALTYPVRSQRKEPIDTVAPASPTLDASTSTAAPVERRAPVILVATANEAVGARHLRSLSLELNDIVAALGEAQSGGICEVVTLPDATPEQVMRVFQNDAYRDRIGVLHFAGHAGPEGLLFETADGTTAVADASGLAAFLGCQRGLQLVVLNACATQAHVDALRDAGVGAVVATSRSVEDAIAHQFAVLLYQGLGSGAGIKRAYDEAASGVRFKHGAVTRGSTADSMHASADAASQVVPPAPESSGSRDIGRKSAVTTDDGRWPWDLYFRRGAEETVGPWALPEAAGNPLFGLPTLPETDEPLTEPFRHLRPFSRKHAELFFGRGKDIRELYDKVTSAASESVVLLYGATGVGKSSLLDAGLLPRLTSTHEVRYAPRDRALGLLGTLATTLGVEATRATDAEAVAERWRAVEAQCGRPLFVVVDQLEEAYTTEDAGRVAAGSGARELDAFAAAIANLFATPASRPRGRLVLGFRKEWLSEVKGALEAHRVARTEHRLEQLTRGGVLEAITGPTRVPARRMPTRLELEAGLDVVIADDLLANRASHVAPLLQILLAELWADAPRKGSPANVVRFDAALYETVRAKAKQLDGFVTQQLEALRTWNAAAVDSGLALEFLRFYTTPKATSDEHSTSEESKRYPHANETAPGLRAMCARLFLLVVRDTDDTGAPLADPTARLAHDTLAPIVRDRFDRSDLPGPRAKRVLDGRSAEWKDGHVGIPLDAADLAVVETGESGMRAWNDEEQALVAASRAERDRARRRRAWVVRGAIAAAALIAAFGVGSWILYRQSQARLADSTSREWGARASSADPEQRDLGFLYAVASYQQSPTFEARRALFMQLASDPTLVRVTSTGGTKLVFAPDGERALLVGPDGIYTMDVATGVETRQTAFPAEVNRNAVALDASGMTYSSVSGDSTSDVATLRVWDAATGRKLGEVPVLRWSEAELREAKKTKAAAIAAAVSDSLSLSLGETPVAGTSWPESLAWRVGPPTADGRHVLAVGEGNDVVLFDLETGRSRSRLVGHTSPPFPAAFSTDGSLVVTMADNGRTSVWDVATGKLVRTVRGGSRFLPPGVAVSRDNSTLVISGRMTSGDTLALWPLRSNRPARLMTGVTFSDVAFTERDAALVAAAPNGEVRVFERPLDASQPLDPGAPSLTLHGAGDIPDVLVVSGTRGRIATLTLEGTVHVWDLADSALIRRSALPIDTATKVTSLTKDGRLAVTQRGFGGELAVWDITASPAVLRAVYDRAARWRIVGQDVYIGASGGLLVAGSSDGDGGPAYVFQGAGDAPDRLVGSPKDAAVAVDASTARVAYALPGTRTVVVADLAARTADTLRAGVDNGPKFWDSNLPAPVEFSPRGDLLVTQGPQFSILVWDLATRRVRDSLSGIGVYAGLGTSADGSVVAALDGLMVQFWTRGRHEPTSRFRWKSGPPPDVFALSPDGRLFAIDTDGVVTLGDVARGDIIGEIETGQGQAVGLTFGDSGRALLAVNAAGQMVRILTDPEAWLARACAVAYSKESIDRWIVDAPAGSRPPQRCTR